MMRKKRGFQWKRSKVGVSERGWGHGKKRIKIDREYCNHDEKTSPMG